MLESAVRQRYGKTHDITVQELGDIAGQLAVSAAIMTWKQLDEVFDSNG